MGSALKKMEVVEEFPAKSLYPSACAIPAMPQQESAEKTLDITGEDRIASTTLSSSVNRSQAEAGDACADISLSRSGSLSRLNARAPEFLPRALSPAPEGHPLIVKIHHHPQPSPPVLHVFHPPSPPPTGSPRFPLPGPPIGLYEYYGGAVEGKGGFDEQDNVQTSVDPNTAVPAREDLSEEIVQKITKQVEYYFSDANLATTEHLMRFIGKDPDGFVPISVVASFKKIKALVHNNLLLANALRTSSKLIISDDGKKVRRMQPFTESDVEELQSRIVVAENLPEDHSYHNLMKVFSVAGSVKTIRTCYPQTPNGSTAPTSRLSKLDMLFGNKLHAFVEYETVEDAERAVAEINKERNWRNGLRLRLFDKCMAKHGSSYGRKSGSDVDGAVEEEEAHTTNHHLNDKHLEDVASHQVDAAFEIPGVVANDKEGGVRRCWARGRGRGRGHGQYQHQNSNSHHRGGSGHSHAFGTPPSGHQNHVEQHAAAPRQPPPGPRMPDGTRGFTMGRGKPTAPPSSTATAG